MERINEEEAKEALEEGYPEAEEMIKDVDRTEQFLKDLENKLLLIPKLGKKLSMIPVMISMVRDFIRKKYTRVPAGSIIAIVSALIYVFNPLDIVPDVIPGAGYIDDAAVIAICIKLVNSDLKDYREWKEKKSK